MAIHVRTCVNNQTHDFLCEPYDTALSALRNQLQLTGTKEGCGTGDCGACSILLNGDAVCACLVLAAELERQTVETVEGVARNNTLHPVQNKLLEHAGLQCGICTPGFVIAAKALLESNPDPDEKEVRFGLAGNLCRCTGYDKIVRAVLAAAEELRSEENVGKT